MNPAKIVDLFVWAAGIALVIYFGSSVVSSIQAPAKLDAALGNNAALAEGVKAQNAGIDGLAKDGKARQAKSEAAVKTAGAPQYQRANGIAAAKPEGDSDYDRAVNRVNRELGLK